MCESYCDNCPQQGDCDGESCDLATNPMGNICGDPAMALAEKRERDEDRARSEEHERREQLTPEQRRQEDEREQRRQENYERECREHEARQEGIKAGLAYVQKHSGTARSI